MKTGLKFSVILPMVQHNGTDNTPAIDAITREISLLTGGYTEYPSIGGWVDETTGMVYTDTSKTVYTYCTDEQVAILTTRAAAWAVELQQIALTVEVSIVQYAFVEGTRSQDLAA